MLRSFSRASAASLAAIVSLAACASAAEPDGATPVSQVQVTPGAAALVLGGTASAQLTAVARDAEGGVLADREFTWSSSQASVATVSASGLVTAVAAGSATISATSEGVHGTATVTVTTGGGASPTILFQEGFEDNAWASRGWYDTGAMATTTTERVGGSRALVGAFALGATNVTGGLGRVAFAPTTSLYLSYWVKYSANWVGSGGTSHPHEFFFLTTENTAFTGPARTRLTAYVEHNYQNGGRPVLAWQDGQNIDETRPNQDLIGVTESRAVAGCNGNADGIQSSCYTVGGQYWNVKQMRAAAPRFLPDPGPGYKNEWHRVEAYFQLNTIVGGIGQSNGIARYWFDGALVLEATNVQFRTGAHPDMRFNQMILSPYIGPGSPVAQTMWIDDIMLATARP